MKRSMISLGKACLLSGFAGLFALIQAGCSEDVVAILDEDRAYTLYGLLLPEADTQWVRIYRIEDLLRPVNPDPLGAQFNSTDLTTGAAQVWRDTILTEPDGQPAHAFWSVFRPEYGHTYHLEATRPDGAVSSASVSVPVRTDIQVLEASAVYPVEIPILIQAPNSSLMQVRLDYLVQFRPGLPGPTNTVRIEVGASTILQQEGGGWLFRVPLMTHYYMIDTDLWNMELCSPCDYIELHEMRLRLNVVSEDWTTPDGSLNPLLLAQERVLWNVDNGYGFIGAGYRLEKAWLPPLEIRSAAGFTVPAP